MSDQFLLKSHEMMLFFAEKKEGILKSIADLNEHFKPKEITTVYLSLEDSGNIQAFCAESGSTKCEIYKFNGKLLVFGDIRWDRVADENSVKYNVTMPYKVFTSVKL